MISRSKFFGVVAGIAIVIVAAVFVALGHRLLSFFLTAIYLLLLAVSVVRKRNDVDGTADAYLLNRLMSQHGENEGTDSDSGD